jgi:hypothetical protein
MWADAGGPTNVEPDAASVAVDAGEADAEETDAFDAANAPGLDAAIATPCLGGGNVFYADGQEYPGVSGVVTIDGSQGTWSGTFTSETVLQLNVVQPDGGTWMFSASSDLTKGLALTPGTYTSGSDGRFPYAAVGGPETVGCQAEPTGMFTIADLTWTGGDEGAPTTVLAWFELTCPLGGATVVGCVSYQQ